MIELQELEDRTLSSSLSARYLIISTDTVIHRFNAMDSQAAKKIRDLEFPGCELAISINEEG